MLCTHGVGSGVYSGNILLDNLQSEDADVSMPGGELPPGEALSRELFW